MPSNQVVEIERIEKPPIFLVFSSSTITKLTGLFAPSYDKNKISIGGKCCQFFRENKSIH